MANRKSIHDFDWESEGATVRVGEEVIEGTANVKGSYVQEWIDTSDRTGKSEIPGLKSITKLSGTFTAIDKNALQGLGPGIPVELTLPSPEGRPRVQVTLAPTAVLGQFRIDSLPVRL